MSPTETDTGVGVRFLGALTRRDYGSLAECFAADAAMRAIVPPGLREDDGREAIVARFKLWTADLAGYELVDADATPFADLLRLRWAVRGVDRELGPCVYEQTAYAEVSDGRIARMRLACSGDRPL